MVVVDDPLWLGGVLGGVQTHLSYRVPQLLFSALLNCMALPANDTPSVANVEDASWVLQPIQVSCNLLHNIALPSGGQAHHDNDQLCAYISF